jgi:hypothetical protein
MARNGDQSGYHHCDLKAVVSSTQNSAPKHYCTAKTLRRLNTA